MSTKVLERAGELADAIAECEELNEIRDAEIKMNNDPEAVKILDEFRKKQQHLYSIQMTGGEISATEQQEYEEIENKMQQNSYIKAYIDASEKFEDLMKSVNMVISRAISGDDGCGCGCDSDCGSDCGSSCGC